MLTNTPVLPIAAATFARGLASISTVCAGALKAFARARRNRRDALALAGLDRSMLKDIGISRADLNDAFSSPFWEDPTALLHERAIERRVHRALTRNVPTRRGAAEPVSRQPKLECTTRQAV